MLIKGEGTDVNEVEGLKWIYLGHANGDERAENILDYCRNVLPLETLKEGYKQAQMYMSCIKSKNIPTTYGQLH
jgi:hypothetical protein